MANSRAADVNELLIIADAQLMAERAAWLQNLASERRLSAHTLDAYERDTRQFLTFLTGHLAGPSTLRDIQALRPADFRAFLAARRKRRPGARSLGRNLAGLRSLLRYLEKKGLVNAAGAAPCARRSSRNRCRSRSPTDRRSPSSATRRSCTTNPGSPPATRPS
jgi:site-specific recombinase XerC